MRETVVEYFEERATGSIYSVRELGQLLRSRQLDMRQVARRYKPLPDSTCSVLDEAEELAARADRGKQQRQPGP